MVGSIDPIELNKVSDHIGVGLAIAVTPYMVESGVKLIRNQNIRRNKFDVSSVVYLDPSFAASQATKTIRSGDVVIVRTGANIGDACVVPEEFDGAQSFTTLVVRPNKKHLLPQFLAQYINSDFGRSEVERLMAGGGKGNLNSGELEKFRVKLLPVDQQAYVSELLTAWDLAEEKTAGLISAREKQHRWLLQQLIEHKVGRAHWETQELGSLIRERFERSSGHDEHPVLTSSRRGLFLQSEYFSKQVTSEDNTGYKIMRRGDFTFRSMSDDGRFVFNRLEKYESGIISPAYGVFYAEGVCPEFLAHYLNSGYFAQLLARETQGGTRKALRFSALAGMEVDLPKYTDQERIAKILDGSRHEIALFQSKLELLRRQKRGLMQKLLTGKWRVPVTEVEVA